MQSPWTASLDVRLARDAMIELGGDTRDLLLEYTYDALAMGVGDGALLRTVIVPADASFRVKTDRYKHGGFRFHAVLPHTERVAFKRMLFACESSHVSFCLKDGVVKFEDGTFLCPSDIRYERADSQPIAMMKGLFCSEIHFRIDIDPVELDGLVQTIRPRENNDAIIVEWRGRKITLTGLVKALDDESRIHVAPRVLSLAGLHRKKNPWHGSPAINMQGRNAVKVDGERLCAALEWIGSDRAMEVFVGRNPLAIGMRRKTPVARHAMLMMQRFLPEEIEYLDRER